MLKPSIHNDSKATPRIFSGQPWFRIFVLIRGSQVSRQYMRQWQSSIEYENLSFHQDLSTGFLKSFYSHFDGVLPWRSLMNCDGMMLLSGQPYWQFMLNCEAMKSPIVWWICSLRAFTAWLPKRSDALKMKAMLGKCVGFDRGNPLFCPCEEHPAQCGRCVLSYQVRKYVSNKHTTWIWFGYRISIHVPNIALNFKLLF